jgi:ABC-2 type transport system ATP-binding protein
MEIILEQTGKRYRLDWIFRNLSVQLRAGERYAILGPNGSGKSTLLKVLSGHLTPSKGRIIFQENGKKLDAEGIFRQMSYAAPYIELIEEFTLKEALVFHSRLKPLLPGITPQKISEILSLPRALNKEIRFFSSGMKQRAKLALAVLSDTPKQLIQEYAGQRLVVIASNDPHDAAFCPRHLHILDYKK